MAKATPPLEVASESAGVNDQAQQRMADGYIVIAAIKYVKPSRLAGIRRKIGWHRTALLRTCTGVDYAQEGWQ